MNVKPINLAVFGTGTGCCALTNKEGADGLTVAFEGEQQTFLSWRAFRQLLGMRAGQVKPAPVAAGNGPALVK